MVQANGSKTTPHECSWRHPWTPALPCPHCALYEHSACHGTTHHTTRANLSISVGYHEKGIFPAHRKSSLYSNSWGQMGLGYILAPSTLQVWHNCCWILCIPQAKEGKERVQIHVDRVWIYPFHSYSLWVKIDTNGSSTGKCRCWGGTSTERKRELLWVTS